MYGVQYAIYIERETVLCSVWCPVCYIYREGDYIVQCMVSSVATGCGFKEIYRFPHTTYPYSSCICPFLQQHPYFFVHVKKCFAFLFQYFF